MERAPLSRVVMLLGACCLATIAKSALGPRYGGELTVSVSSRPTLEDPVVPHGDGDRLISRLAHESLVGIQPDGFPAPGLVGAWTSARDGREWTLELRADARFHDGGPVTADHAVRSLRRFLRSASPAAAVAAEHLEGASAFRRGESEALAGVFAAGDRGLVLRFERPRALPFAPLAAPAAAITGERGAGCGPFVPTLRLPSNGGRVLTAFGEHIRGRPFLDRVRVVPATRPDAAASDLAAGRIDVAPGVGGTSAPASILLLVLDPTQPPFERVESRRLVSAAIDSEELVKHLLPEADPTPSLLPVTLLPPVASPAPGAASGRLGGSITMAVAEDVPRLVSQRVLAHLSALGLRASVEPVKPSQISSATAQARLLLFTPEVPEAGLALRELVTLARPAEGVLEELEAADLEYNPDRRRVRLHRAEAVLRADACLVPVAAVPISFAARKGVHGLSVDAAGRLVLENVWVEP